MSLVQGRERLTLAARQLTAEWQALKEVWRDENCRQFEEKTMATLESEIRASILAMDRVEAALHTARYECGDREGFEA